MRCGGVSLMREKIAELYMHFECRGVITFACGREVCAEKILSEFRRAMSIRENAGRVNQRRSFVAVGSDAGL